MASHDKEVISKVLFARAPWDAIDTEFMKRIPFDDPAEFEDCLCREVQSGKAESLRILHDGKRVGIAVIRIEEEAAREMVICAIFCDAPVPLSREIQTALHLIAKDRKCVSMRFHTVRPAAARLAAEEYGYRLSEIVMRRAV
jgi:hypothetical protein